MAYRHMSLQKVRCLCCYGASFLCRMVVGQTLQILGPTDENAREKYQWYQIDPHGDWIPISGATRNQVGLCPDLMSP